MQLADGALPAQRVLYANADGEALRDVLLLIVLSLRVAPAVPVAVRSDGALAGSGPWRGGDTLPRWEWMGRSLRVSLLTST